MKYQFLVFILILASLCGCQNCNESLGGLNDLKRDFIHNIFESEVEDGPFQLKYSLRTVFFSKDVVSLFGEFDEYTHLPHGRARYEGKTFCKVNEQFEKITLSELFTTAEQREFLRNHCEQALRNQKITYFSGEDPLRMRLTVEDIQTFVIDDQFLIIIFQPYVAGGYADGPFFVKIPYEILKDGWNPKNRLSLALKQAVDSKSFVSTWDRDWFLENLGQTN